MDADTQNTLINQIKERKQLYLDIFDSDKGKLLLEELSKTLFSKKTTYNDNPQRMAFNEGQRSVLLHIQNMMKVDVDKTIEAIKKQGESNE